MLLLTSLFTFTVVVDTSQSKTQTMEKLDRGNSLVKVNDQNRNVYLKYVKD